MTKYKINANYFDEINTPEKAQTLGFLFADGFVLNNVFGICISRVDLNYLTKIRENLSSEHPIKISKNEKYIRLYISNKHIYNKLVSLGCVPRKSLVLKFPTHLNPNLYRYFILGYFEGDGSVFITNGKRISPGLNICGTYDMCKSIKDFIFSETGVDMKMEKYNTKSGKTYGINSRGRRKIVKVFNFLYEGCSFSMERKYSKFLQIEGKLKPKTSKYSGINFSEGKWRGEVRFNKKTIKTKRAESENSAVLLFNELCDSLGLFEKRIKL